MNTPPVNRRNFFRVGLRQLLEPIADAVESAQRASQSQPVRAKQPVLDAWLRPPGAIGEQLFVETCSRSGECVNVCPARAIKLDRAGANGRGAPYIDPDDMSCVLCDGLYCMQACPSGALRPVALVDIRMGLARWREETCLRTSGEECTICIDKCPIGSAAIELRDGKVNVLESGCTGCGVCQHECPASPKSIVVQPTA